MGKTLIKNVKLIDGVNYFGENRSVIVNNNIIESITTDCHINENSFSRIIDGENQFLTPTFIDAHSHSDVSILSPFELTSKKSSGFGVEIVGNCGLSCFPISEKNIDNLKKIYQKYPVEINWKNFNEYQEKTALNATGTQIFSLTGHNTLHSAVAAYEKRKSTEAEIKTMQKILSETLEAGSLGLSFGLLYTPGRFASDAEIIALMQTVESYKKIVCIHLKSEGDKLIESLTETLEFARKAKLEKLHISHLKTGGENNFHKIDRLLEIIENAPKNYGVSVTFDRYPFCQSLTQLSVAGPEKFLSIPDNQIMKILQESHEECLNFCQYLRNKDEKYFSKIILTATQLSDYQSFIGMKIPQIAHHTNQSIDQLILDLIKYDSVNTLAAFESMSETNMQKIISHPLCIAGSDETARPLDYRLGASHIRNFGTASEFIKILCQLNLDKSVIIKKLSYNSAKRFSLPQCGEIKEKFPAKFNLINFDCIKTNATFSSPHQISDGIKPVI